MANERTPQDSGATSRLADALERIEERLAPAAQARPVDPPINQEAFRHQVLSSPIWRAAQERKRRYLEEHDDQQH